MVVRVVYRPFRSTTEPPPFSAFPSFVHALHANVSNIIRAVSEYEIVWKWNGKRRSASIWCFLLLERGVPSPGVMKTNFEDGPRSTRNRAESIFHRAMSNSGREDSRRILERLTVNFYLFSYLFIIVRNVKNRRFRFLRLNTYIVKYSRWKEKLRDRWKTVGGNVKDTNSLPRPSLFQQHTEYTGGP